MQLEMKKWRKIVCKKNANKQQKSANKHAERCRSYNEEKGS